MQYGQMEPSTNSQHNCGQRAILHNPAARPQVPAGQTCFSRRLYNNINGIVPENIFFKSGHIGCNYKTNMNTFPSKNILSDVTVKD